MNTDDQPEPAGPGNPAPPEVASAPEAPPAGAAASPAVGAESPAVPVQRPRKIGLVAALAGCIVAADLITKIIAVANLTPGTSVRVLGGVVYLSILRNAGAAFSTGTGFTWILALIAIGVVVMIIRMARKLRSTIWAVCLGLVLGGAIGNLIDRIFRSPGVLRGHVVDFISLFGPDAKYFAVFNVADSAITIGGITLVITAMLGIDFDGGRTRRASKAKPAAETEATDRESDPGRG